MTDIILLGPRNVGLLSVSSEPLFATEVGLRKDVGCTLTIGQGMKVWPEKVGEMLASMYYLATCNYLDKLKTIPAAIQWRAYGVFTIRSLSCLVLQMDLDGDGCHVSMLYEGSNLSLGAVIEYVVNKMKR